MSARRQLTLDERAKLVRAAAAIYEARLADPLPQGADRFEKVIRGAERHVVTMVRNGVPPFVLHTLVSNLAVARSWGGDGCPPELLHSISRDSHQMPRRRAEYATIRGRIEAAR